MEVTTKEFSKNYWRDIKLSQRINKSFKNEIVISETVVKKVVNYIIQILIYKITGSKILENHKLEIMDKDVVLNMLSNKEVDIIYSDYIGGFEPSIFYIQDIKSSFVRFLFKIVSKTFCLLFGQCNSKLISSYFILILRKK